MKPTFLKNGWTVVKEFGTGSSVITLSSTQNGADAWLAVDMDPTVKIDMVLVGPVPVTLALAAPAF